MLLCRTGDLVACCQVIWIANHLSGCPQRVFSLHRRLDLWRKDDSSSAIGSLDDESFPVGLKNEAIESFFADDFAL